MLSAKEYIQKILSDDNEMPNEVIIEIPPDNNDSRELLLVLKALQLYPERAQIVEKLKLAFIECDEVIQILSDLSFLPNLQELSISSFGLGELDCSMLSNLRDLDISEGTIRSVNVSGLKKLEKIFSFDSDLEELNLSGTSNLREIANGSPDLLPLDLTGLSQLEILDLRDGKTTELNCTDLTNLKELYVYVYVRLAKLNLQHATRLETLRIGDGLHDNDEQVEQDIDYVNPLAKLELSGLQNIKDLKVSHTKVTILDLTEQTLLQHLDIKFSSIHSIYSKLQNVQIVGFGALSHATRIALMHLKPGENNMLTTDILDAHFTNLFQKLLQEVISAEFKEDLVKLFILRERYATDMIIRHLISDHGMTQKIQRNIAFLRKSFTNNATDVLEEYLTSQRFKQLQEQALGAANSMITTVCERFQQVLLAPQNLAVTQADTATSSSLLQEPIARPEKRLKPGYL